MMALRMHRSERGVSLIEVLVALAIMSFVAVAIIAGIFMSVKSNEVSRKFISADSLARAELDYVKATENNTAWYAISWDPTKVPWSYTLTSTPASSPPTPWLDTNHKSLPAGYDGYSVTCSAISLPATTDTTYNAEIQRITVTVYLNGEPVFQIGTNRTK